jgi:hypothetical protein
MKSFLLFTIILKTSNIYFLVKPNKKTMQVHIEMPKLHLLIVEVSIFM